MARRWTGNFNQPITYAVPGITNVIVKFSPEKYFP
jgi:hypothetical protein